MNRPTLYTLYRASHPTAGSYVGFTELTLASRRSRHVATAKAGSLVPLAVALRKTNYQGWVWESLGSHTDKVEIEAAEAMAIRTFQPSLNIRKGGKGGGKWPKDFNHGGHKNLGRTASPEVKAWFRKFHSERPRKRRVDRWQILALHREGWNQTEIARSLSCHQSLVSNVIRGIYKL
jgi:predicted XRE-type DNA-binding protein